MKITIISPTLSYKGGIAHYNNLLSKELEKKHKVDVISFKRLYPKFLYPSNSPIDTKSKINSYKEKAYYLLDSINPLTWIKTFFRIKKFKANLLLIHWWVPFFAPMVNFITLLVRLFTKTKILFICHNVLPHEKIRLDKFLVKLAFMHVNYFIVHAKSDEEILKNLIPKANISISPLPTFSLDDIDTTHFSKEEFKKKLGLHKKVILFFGFIRPSKGLIYLIKAMPYVLKELKLNLLVVGELFERFVSKSRINYFKEVDKLKIGNNVKFITKYVPNEDIIKYFSVSDVLVLPYLTATQSGPLQIAFGLNKPVICTSVGGLPEAVTNNKTGLLVPPKNPEKLAEAIIKFYKEKKEKIFINNIKKEKQKFGWDKMVKTIESFSFKNNHCKTDKLFKQITKGVNYV